MMLRRAAILILLGALVRLAILDRLAPDLTRGDESFLIEGVSNGFRASQVFDVRGDGLAEVDLEGQVTGTGREGVLEARLFELADRGAEREVRQALYAVSRAAGACCRLRFPELSDSAGKRFRVDLRARDFDGSLGLSLEGVAAGGVGGLIINGHLQPANLAIDTGGATLYPLRNQRRINLWWLMIGFAIIDGTAAFVVHSLIGINPVNASGRLPS